ncbi:hypothetical protein MNBD_GAMMA12-1968 [hydrothermal vent metagenome]|uniref:Uncharacterized protein n=1 Tax=hydrothermal vent metagenome TaxID=652676 RepID=A0A3B0YR77_9ZZZZ
MLLLLVTNHWVYAKCGQVAPGYEQKSTMYVVCRDLNVNNKREATLLIKKVMSQYSGPPDEIVIHFVKSKSSIGEAKPTAQESVGYYYTHNNRLLIWPKIKSKAKVFILSVE